MVYPSASAPPPTTESVAASGIEPEYMSQWDRTERQAEQEERLPPPSHHPRRRHHQQHHHHHINQHQHPPPRRSHPQYHDGSPAPYHDPYEEERQRRVAAAAAAAAAAAGEEAARYSRLRQYEYLQLKERQLQEEIIVQRDLERHRQQQQQQQQDEAILQQHLQLAQQQQLQQQLQQHLLQQQQPPLPPPSGLNPLVMAIPLSEVEKRAFLDGTLQVPPNMVLRQTTDGTPVLVSTVHEAPPPPPPPQPHYLPHPNHPHPSGGGPRMMADDRIRPEDLDRLLLLQQQQHPHLPQGGGIFSVPSSTASYAVADLPAPHGPPGPHQPPRYVSTASSSMDSPPLPSISISTSHGGGDDRSKESPPPPPPPPQFRAVESTTGSTTTNTTPTTKLHKLKHGLPFFTTKLSNVKKWKMSKKRSLSATFRPSENSVIVFVQHVPPASGADGDDGQVTVEVSSSVALKDIVRNHLKEYIRVPTHLLREQPPPSSSMSSPQDLADMVRRHKHRIIRKVIKTVNILCRSDSDAVDYDHGDGNNNNNSNSSSSENVGFCCREDSRWWELSDEASARVVKEMFSVCRKEYIDEKLQKGRTTLKKEKKDREDREIREMIVQQERERAMRGIKTHSLSSSAAATAAAANVVSVVPPPLSPPPDDAEVVVLTEPSQPPPAKKRKISSTSTGTANVGEPKRPNHAGQTKLKRKNKLPTSMRRKLPSIDNSDYYDSTDSGGDDDRNDYGHGDSHDDGPGGGGGSRADHNNGATGGGRGAYKCGLCGKPKVGHICPFRNDQRSNGRDKPQQQQPPPSKVDDDRNLDDVDPAEGWSTYRGGIQVFKQDVYYTAARVADGTRVPGEEQDKEEKPDDDNNEEVVVERRPQEEVGKKLLVETLLVVDDDDDDSETGGRPEVGGGGGGGGSEEDVDDGDSESDDDLVF